MTKQLARLAEAQQPSFSNCLKNINQIARETGLQEYKTFSRIWEYPWIWFRMQSLKGKNLRVLDIGSERSPFPWFLATQGFHVTVSDLTASYWRAWQRASRQLKVAVSKCIVDAQNLDLPTASVDIYLSVSVIEHVPDKAKAITEAARVLRPGGLLVMTFDICEPDMGMSFPEWNGRALTMQEFDELFKNSPWFEPGLSELPWNTGDIADYLAWHRTTAQWHNYITGAAVVRRNDRIWTEPAWKDRLRILRGKISSFSSVSAWYLQYSPRAVRHKIARRIKSAIRRGLSLLTSCCFALR
jgi:SAM-dependent methyltransferase